MYLKKTQVILAVLLLLCTLNSTFYFFIILKVNFIEWIFFNACAVTCVVYLIGFVLYLIKKNRIIIFTSILPMFYFGGISLYLFPWTGFALIAQAHHLIMVLNILLAVIVLFKENDFKNAVIGLLLGILVFSFFIQMQQNYVNSHPEFIADKLGLNPEDFRDKLNIK